MISNKMNQILTSPSNGVIRKMFEEGIQLKQKFGAENVFDFSLGNPDLEPPAKLLESLKNIANDNFHGSHGYMSNAGYPQTRLAMAKKTSLEQGVSVGADQIIMSVGAAAALNCVLKALLNDGDEVLVPAPYFTEYGHYCRNHGGTLVTVKTKEDFSLDLDAIKASLNTKTAAIIINSPNNPTGKIYTDEDIKGLADILKEHGNKTGRFPYIICDEPYRAIVYDNKKVSAVFPEYPYAVVVTSFAKNLSIPGERIGYIAVNPANPESKEMVNACILATRILGFVNAPALFQRVVTESWDAYCDYSLYEKRCKELCEILDYAGYKYAKPEGAFYLFVKVPEKWNDDDMAFCDHLKKFNILTAPGSGFGGKGWFRIAYCVSEQTILNSKEAFYKANH